MSEISASRSQLGKGFINTMYQYKTNNYEWEDMQCQIIPLYDDMGALSIEKH